MQPKWLIPTLIGGAIVAGVLAFTRKAESSTKTQKTCPVDRQKFETWLIEKGLAGECAPELTTAPANYKALQEAKLAPAEFYPYVLVLGDGSFWYYPDPSSTASKSENLRSQYAAYSGGGIGWITA